MKLRSMIAKQVRITLTLAVTGVAVSLSQHSLADSAGKATDAIWANGALYDTVLTDTAFASPPPHSTDVIFSFAASGLDGQRSVAEAAPGDPDYNGGRWHVMTVTYTQAGLDEFDPDGDGAVNQEIQHAASLLEYAEMGLLTIHDTAIRFECPLLPRRGHRP